MSEDLRRYYESELTFIRQSFGEFAAKYPKIAGRLQLDETREAADPHVERLVQAFALLTARVRHKIDDEFPEVVESLLNLLYPHYLRPIPSMAIAQFRFDPQQSKASEPVEIPGQSHLHVRAAAGSECAFRTSYPVTVWPLQVSDAALLPVGSARVGSAPANAASVVRLRIETLGGLPLAALRLPKLRFFLSGEGTPNYLLYELLLGNAAGVQIRGVEQSSRTDTFFLPSTAIRPVGFEPADALLPYTDRSFLGYRLLQEYFHFPQKFLFFDLTGLDRVRLGDFGGAFEILIFLRDSALREQILTIGQTVHRQTFQLGCTPIVNLYKLAAEPIRVSHTVSEYRVVPDRHRQLSTEVYSIDRVASAAAYGEEPQVYEPLYSFRHAHRESQSQCFWYAHRRPSMRKEDEGTDVYLSLVDLNFKPAMPATEVLAVQVTCTNRDFVSRIAWNRGWGEIEGEGLPMVQARCTVSPTRQLRPPLRGSLQWRLISHLALNHLSLVQGGGREALQEILRLYCFHHDEEVLKRIAGITDLKSQASVSRLPFDEGITFVRGLDLELELDEELFAGSGTYLFAAVLERFFSLYSAINSYSRLTARTRNRPLQRWPARAGDRRLL